MEFSKHHLFLAFIILTLSSSALGATTLAPTTPQPECPRFGTFGDPNDCHVFYKCFGPIKIKFTCPLNMAYVNSPFLCTTVLDSCPPFKCTAEGTFEDQKSCLNYYTCVKSGTTFVTTHHACPFLTSFNPATRTCRFGYLDCFF